MSDFYTRDFDSLSAPPRRDNLFLWTVFILLLMGFAMACWLGSFYIFGHPEDVAELRILQKLHKLDPPKRFEITAAPPGEFLTAQKLFERYNTYPPLRLKAENDELLRMYITNYQSTKKLVPYIVGRFTILDSRELAPADFFPSGVAAVAERPIFPRCCSSTFTPPTPGMCLRSKAMLKTGLDVKLARTLDLAAVIHIQRLENGSLQFTAVPLLYGSYALKQGEGTFSLAAAARHQPRGRPANRPRAGDGSDLAGIRAIPAGEHPGLECARPADGHAGGLHAAARLGTGASGCQPGSGNLPADARSKSQRRRFPTPPAAVAVASHASRSSPIARPSPLLAVNQPRPAPSGNASRDHARRDPGRGLFHRGGAHSLSAIRPGAGHHEQRCKLAHLCSGPDAARTGHPAFGCRTAC